MKKEFTLRVNEQIHQVEVEQDTPLLFVLRNDLGLKGVKYGCGSEQCGACKVLIDRQAVPTCKLPVKNVAGLRITTIEGLGTASNLHPLQEAFIEEQAIQCGYCTSGMIVATQGLLNRPGYPFLGSGEAAQGSTPAAISNAIFDAVGIRLREIPFTPQRVKAALNKN